jgi:Na+/proline symporter
MNLYAITLALIVLTLLGVSLTRLGKVRTRADYLVAGRSLPAFVLVFTLLSSWIGSGSLLGGAENAYRHGFAALWQAAGGWAGLALIYFIAPRARRFAQYTIPDLLEARYNQTARVLGVIAILFTYTAITSYQLIGGGDILHLIFPSALTSIHGRYLIAGFVILFTAIAGMSSVAYMDVAIGLLATFTLCLALPVLVHNFAFANSTGWSAVRAALPATHFQILGDLTLIQALELFLPTCLLMLGNQSMYQKFFSARSERDATRAVTGWIVGTVILETVIVALAVAGSAVFPTGEVHDHPREILAYIGLHGFEPTQTVITIPREGAANTDRLNAPEDARHSGPPGSESPYLSSPNPPPSNARHSGPPGSESPYLSSPNTPPSNARHSGPPGSESPYLSSPNPSSSIVITTTQILPPILLQALHLLGALLVGAIFAKIISTANNYLFSPATNLVNDIFVRYLRPNAGNRQVLLVSRLMVVLLGLWALFQSLGTESVLQKALYAYTIYSAALTPVILAAFYWRRATASAAVASIFTGTVVTVTWDTAFLHTRLPAILAGRDAIFPALIASLLCLIVVSLLTPPPNAAHLRAFAEDPIAHA